MYEGCFSFGKGTREKNWRECGSKPTFLSLEARAHDTKEQADLGGQDLRAQICGRGSIPDPLCHSTFIKGGGGGFQNEQ
jgi:hypothetical protein